MAKTKIQIHFENARHTKEYLTIELNCTGSGFSLSKAQVIKEMEQSIAQEFDRLKEFYSIEEGTK